MSVRVGGSTAWGSTAQTTTHTKAHTTHTAPPMLLYSTYCNDETNKDYQRGRFHIQEDATSKKWQELNFRPLQDTLRNKPQGVRRMGQEIGLCLLTLWGFSLFQYLLRYYRRKRRAPRCENHKAKQLHYRLNHYWGGGFLSSSKLAA